MASEMDAWTAARRAILMGTLVGGLGAVQDPDVLHMAGRIGVSVAGMVALVLFWRGVARALAD